LVILRRKIGEKGKMKTLKELQEEIVKLKDDDKDARAYLSALGDVVPGRLAPKKVTEKEVDEFLDSEEGKKYLQPKLDAYHSKGLTSWQEKNLEKIKAEAIASVTTVSPEIKRIAELESRLNEEVGEIKQFYSDGNLNRLSFQ
jgi:hypothetical protein